MEAFFNITLEILPQINKVIRKYFEAKFLDKKCRLRVPKFLKPSSLITK